MTSATSVAGQVPGAQGDELSPATPVFYRINIRRVSRAECLASTPSAIGANIAWVLLKLVGDRLPVSSDDPPVESLQPFEVAREDLPPPIRELFAKGIEELAPLGFGAPVYHAIVDPLHKTETYLATGTGPAGRAVARLHVRLWGITSPAKSNVYAEFITPFADGTHLWSMSSRFDLAAPPSCRLVRATGASVAELWNRHAAALGADAARTSIGVTTPDDGVAVTERLHQIVRDFHLARGVFAPRTQADQRRLQSMSPLQDSPSRHPQVIAEIQRILSATAGWRGPLMLLLVSLAFFLLIGIRGFSWPRLLALVPILLFHELGHYAAMKAFGYRNLRMFFIPGLGAAVTGRHFNIPGWKRAVTFLAGPLPGVFLAIPVGLAGMVWDSGFALQAAILTLLLNAFNLLPVLPLDGGHVLNITVFSRHHVVEAVFRGLAAAGVAALGLALGSPIFIGLGVLVAMGIPAALQQARLAQALRARGVGATAPDNQNVPVPVADEIIDALLAGAKRPANATRLAVRTLGIFEELNSRRPGWLASISLLVVHGVSLVAALVFLVVFTLADRGSFRTFRERNTYEPEYTLAITDIRAHPPRAADGSPGAGSTFVGTFATPQEAGAAFDAARAGLAPSERAAVVGNTLLVRFDASDNDARLRWINRFDGQTQDAFVQSASQHADFSISLRAPDAETAARVGAELNAYFTLPLPLGLRAPWSTAPPSAEDLAARRFFASLEDTLDVWDEAEYAGLDERIEKANRMGNESEAAALTAELAPTRKRLRLERVQKALDATTPGTPQRELATRFRSLITDTPDDTDRASFAVPFLSGLAPAAGSPDQLTHALGGTASVVGTKITLFYVSFADPAAGVPALADWLRANGVSTEKYEVTPVPLDPLDVDDE